MGILAKGKIWLPRVGSGEFMGDQRKDKLINPKGPLAAPFSLLRTNDKSPEQKELIQTYMLFISCCTNNVF
jgi:hypothetical protein